MMTAADLKNGVTTNTSEPRDQESLPSQVTEWSPLIFDRTCLEDRKQMDCLTQAGKIWNRHDTMVQQLIELIKARAPRDNRGFTSQDLHEKIQNLIGHCPIEDFGRWVYYPWSGDLVHVLPPDEFHELRLDRNRNKITTEEQKRLSAVTVGIVGLSVGNTIATTLAMEGTCGHLKLADFDQLDLSNMNRVRAGVQDVGVPKTVLAARQILQLNPYANLTLFDQGLTSDNMDEFLLGEPKLDVLVDECDGIRMKVLLRERARQLHLPVLMETSDRGMVDVERFDLEPDRQLFHGLLGETRSSEITGKLTDEEKTKFVFSILGTDTISARLAASMLEIEESISSWPQLGSDVTLGGATITTAVRRLVLGQSLPSGRRFIDIENILADEAEDQRLEKMEGTSKRLTHASSRSDDMPDFFRFLVEHGAMAPSGGNSQPWQFFFDEKTLWLVHDKQRSKNLFDVFHHGAFLAIGAAIENISIAAASRGFATRTRTFPRGVDSSVVAAMSFESEPGLAESAISSRFDYIRQRVTNRQKSNRLPLRPDHVESLRNSIDVNSCGLDLLTTDDELERIGAILGEGDRIRFLCRDLHREMMCEVRWTQEEAEQTRTGLDLESLELSESQRVALRVCRRPDVASQLRVWSGGRALEQLSSDAIVTSSAVGLFSFCVNDPGDVLDAGRMFQRIWLDATAAQLSLHPMTALLYMFDVLKSDKNAIFNDDERARLTVLKTEIDQLFPSSDQTRLMLFRLSRDCPKPTKKAMRLDLDEILLGGEPPSNI